MISYQLYCFFIFIIIGIISGLIFDIFRILRQTFKTKDFIIYIQDILFWILVGFLMLYGLCAYTNGELRLYLFLGVILGFLIYILTVSKYILKINIKIITFIKNIFKTIFNFLSDFVKKLNILSFFRGKNNNK